jgi:hypothetical protein
MESWVGTKNPVFGSGYNALTFFPKIYRRGIYRAKYIIELRSHDRMVVGFITTYAMTAYDH